MEKIKQIITTAFESEKGKDILIILIVLLVGISSFFLGRLSKNPNQGLKIEYPNNYQENTQSGLNQPNLGQIKTNIAPNKVLEPIQTSLNTTKTGNYFASSRGKKYYTLGCSAGKTIKLENRIYFETSADAEKAGYSLSTSCH